MGKTKRNAPGIVLKLRIPGRLVAEILEKGSASYTETREETETIIRGLFKDNYPEILQVDPYNPKEEIKIKLLEEEVQEAIKIRRRIFEGGELGKLSLKNFCYYAEWMCRVLRMGALQDPLTVLFLQRFSRFLLAKGISGKLKAKVGTLLEKLFLSMLPDLRGETHSKRPSNERILKDWEAMKERMRGVKRNPRNPFHRKKQLEERFPGESKRLIKKMNSMTDANIIYMMLGKQYKHPRGTARKWVFEAKKEAKLFSRIETYLRIKEEHKEFF